MCQIFQSSCAEVFKHILYSPTLYIWTVGILYYFYRVEFQHRGSPHIHGLAWIKDALKFDVHSDEEVCAYIDKIIACTSNVPEDEEDYVKLQKHQHSKTCEKKQEGQWNADLGLHGHH